VTLSVQRSAYGQPLNKRLVKADAQTRLLSWIWKISLFAEQNLPENES